MWQRIFTTLLIFELIVMPLHLSVNSAHASDNCPQGQVYDNSLNRCVLSQSTVSNKTEAQECGGLEGEAARKCFEKNIEDDMAGVEEGEDPKSSYIIPGIVTLGAGYILFANKDALGQCSSTSIWLMLGGGVSSIMGELLSQRAYQKKVKKLMSEYKKDVNESTVNASQEDTQTVSANQTRAFDFQIEQEKARMKAHKARKTTYNIAFGLYAASAAVSIYDGFTNGWDSSCGETDTGGDTQPGGAEPSAPTETTSVTPSSSPLYTPMSNQQAAELFALVEPDIFGSYAHIENIKQEEVYEIILRKVSEVVMPSAQATDPIESELRLPSVTVRPDPAIGGETQAPDLSATGNVGDLPNTQSTMQQNAQNSGIGDTVKKAIRNPGVRAAFAGVLALYSKKVADKAGKLAKKSENRIEALTEIRNDFLAAGGAGFERCSDADRRSPSKPFCYCYDKNGQQDQSKKNNQTCQSVWNNSNLNLIAGTYGKAGQDSAQGVQGCLRRSGQPDPGCQCRNADKDSNQACTNIAGTLSLGGLNGLRTLPGVMNDTAAFTSGRLSSGQLANGSNLNQLISDTEKLKEQMEKNPKTAETVKKINQAQDQLERSLAATARAGLDNGTLSNPFAGGLGDSIDTDDLKADNIVKETNNQLAAVENSFLKQKSAGSGSKKKGFNLDFGPSNTGNNIEIQDDKGIMNKDFSYNSINENQDTDIFKIISVRYQRSGLKRLFDEDFNGPVDEANDVRIHGDQ